MKYDSHETIIRLIKSQAAKNGLTITKLAAKMGVSQPVFSRSLNNGRMTIAFLAKVAEVLECDLFVSMEEKDERARK